MSGLVNILVTPNAFSTKAEEVLSNLLNANEGKLVRIISYKDLRVTETRILDPLIPFIKSLNLGSRFNNLDTTLAKSSRFTDLIIDRDELCRLMDMDLNALPDFTMTFLPTNDEFSIANLAADFKQDILVTIGPPIKFASSKTIILNNKVSDIANISMRRSADIKVIDPIEVYCTSDNGYYKIEYCSITTFDPSVDPAIVLATTTLAALLE